eukprot:4435470-Pyramimonas_sp.AAC.1
MEWGYDAAVHRAPLEHNAWPNQLSSIRVQCVATLNCQALGQPALFAPASCAVSFAVYAAHLACAGLSALPVISHHYHGMQSQRRPTSQNVPAYSVHSAAFSARGAWGTVVWYTAFTSV